MFRTLKSESSARDNRENDSMRADNEITCMLGDVSPFVMLQRWTKASPAYVVANASVVTTITHEDRFVTSGHTNPV